MDRGRADTLFTGIAERLASRDVRREGDREIGGLLYCGTCGKPKQSRVLWFGGSERVVPIECDCAARERREREERQSRTDFDARVKALQDRYNISDTLFSSDTFARDDGKDEKTSLICRRYVERWPEMLRHNEGILFYGTVGTGKTFFANCIANALLERQVCATVTSFPRILNLLQSAPARQEILDALRRYRLLVIDDLGTERDSSFAAEQVYAVVDARIRSKLPLIVTTNLTMKELREPGSIQFKRIYDRVLEACAIRIRMVGESRREENASARAAAAKEILGGEGG